MPNVGRLRAPWSYVVAAAVTAGALACRLALLPGDRPFLVLFVLPVALAAHVGGLLPALLSTAIAAAASRYWLLPPFHSFSLATATDSVQWVLLVASCVVVAWITDSAYRAGRRLEVAERAARSASREAEVSRALREREERFRALFDDSAVGIVELDENDRIVAANARFGAMLDYAPAELLGKTIGELTAAEDADRTRELNARGRAGELHRFEYEKRYVRRDGSYVWVHVHVSVVRDAAGRFVRSVGTAAEIGDRKRAEEAARSLQQAARESQERLAAIIEQFPLATGVLDPSGRLVLGSSELAPYGLDTPPSRDPAQRDRWAAYDEAGRPLPPEQWAAARALRGETVSPGLECVYTAPDGRRVHALVSAVPLRLHDGQQAGAIFALQNIDRLKEVEEELRRADRHKDEFLGMLSHELRNPLAPIRSSVFVLKRADPASPQAARALAVIDRQSEHLTRLVDDLLDVTRIARGKILLHRATADLRQLVARAVEDVQGSADARGVKLRVELPASAPWADADGTRITQIVGNLLHNAIKFTPRGGEIVVSLRSGDGAAELRVRDTGEGIDADLLPTLFDAFVQGTRTLARSEGGLGLGLALVKGLVELHGGSVEARSDGVGRGAEFVVRLPLARPAAGPRASAAPPPRAGVQRRVLVVDDNADAAESLAELVRLFGHDAAVAYDGPSAIEKVRQGRPDVVLCDLGLPGMTGYEVAQALRSEHDGTLRLVAVSGYAQADDVDRATAAGFDAHVAKPADPERIEVLLA